MNIKISSIVIEVSASTIYVAGGSVSLWIEVRPPAWSRSWSCLRSIGSIEAWAGRLYLAASRPPYVSPLEA